MDIIERAGKNKERAEWELRRIVIEKDAKEAAELKVKRAAEKEEALTKDLSAKDEELRVVRAQLKEFKESLETEKATSASLQTEVNQLQEKGNKSEATYGKQPKRWRG